MGDSYPVFTDEGATVGAELPYHAIFLLEEFGFALGIHEGRNGYLRRTVSVVQVEGSMYRRAYFGSQPKVSTKCLFAA